MTTTQLGKIIRDAVEKFESECEEKVCSIRVDRENYTEYDDTGKSISYYHDIQIELLFPGRKEA